MAPRKRPPLDRLLEKVVITEDGCAEWVNYVESNGYARLWVDGKNVLAHRWSYEHHRGPIPAGLVIDHLCRNRACVNPYHLEPVTTLENVLRGIGPEVAAARCQAITHCPQGHEYNEENTFMTANGRSCKTCKRAGARAYYEKNREAVIERARQWHIDNPEKSRAHARTAQRRYRAKKKKEAA